MDSRERVYRLLSFEEADRVALIDFPWPETIDRWRTEGLPRTASIHRFFGFDIYLVGIDVSPKFDPIVLEEADEWVVYRDSYGVVTKSWRGRSGTPMPVEPAIRTLEDFKEYIEPMLDPELPFRATSSRYPFRGDLEKAIKRLQQEFFVAASIFGPFEYVRHIVGEGVNSVLRLVYRDPAMLDYIFDRVGRFLARVADTFEELGADGVWVWDDLAYRNGPFISPQHYRRFVKPQHERILHPFKRRNKPAILHTDGNVKLLIPDFIEAGFTALQPLEVKAGMDVRELKELYGDKLAFIGNIDARVLSKDKESIRREVESKIPMAAKGGGYIAGSDHSVPPDVPLSNYLYFVQLVKEVGRYH
ncbi:MAG: uroporphyrinogen decarboxylase family protein [Thermofilaceae archaeon]